MNRISARTCALTGLAAMALGTAVHAQTITNLGTLGAWGSAEGSSAYGVNANGTVVVGQTTMPTGLHAFYWTQAGMQDLGTLPAGNVSSAHGVSANGQVIAGHSNANNLTGSYAFRFTWSGGMQNLNAGVQSDAVGISADGNAICGNTATVSGTTLYRWTNTGGIQTLASNIAGRVNRISGDGSTVVGQLSVASGIDAIQWTPSGGLVTLPDLPGGTMTLAGAVSFDGSRVGGHGTTGDDFYVHAIRWTNGVAEDLGIPLGMNAHTSAMSADGLVVAGESGGNPTNDAWIWTAPRGFLSLTDFLAGEGVNLAGWDGLQSVGGISADGTAIVGSGLYQGQPRAFVVQGLEPVCGPWIAAHPFDHEVCLDGTTALTVIAYGHGVFQPSLQWEKQVGATWVPLSNGITAGGTTISGVYTYVLTLSGCAADAAGTYRVQVYDGCAPRASLPATITVNSGTATFVQHPADDQICPDASATYSINFVAANGDAPFTIQWERKIAPNVFVPLFNGTTTTWDGNAPGIGGVVSGANTANMTIAADLANGRVLLNAVHASRFRCVVSNACGGVASGEAGLKVWASCTQADINGDQMVNNFDIDPFVLAVVDPDAFRTAYPDVNPANADCNHDGNVNNFDIDPFVACIVAGGCP